MNTSEFERLKLEGEEIFRTICSEVNDISETHVRKDKGVFRRKEDLEEILVALSVYNRKNNINTYNKKIELAFYETGGGIVKEYYDEAIRSKDTLETVVNNIMEDAKLDTEDYSQIKGLPTPSTDKDRIIFIESYIGEKCSHPELCGTVAGILFRNGKHEEVLKFLEIDDMNEPRYWDT